MSRTRRASWIPNNKTLGRFFCWLIGVTLGMVAFYSLRLPFSNPERVVGPLAEAKLNPSNSFMGFALLLTITGLAKYLATRYFPLPTSAQTPTHKLPFKIPHRVREFLKNGSKYFFHGSAALIFVWGFSSFALSYRYYFLPAELDFYHEGEVLAPSFSTYLGNGVWKQAAIIHGAIQDIFSTTWGWQIFNQVSIGSSRTLRLIQTSLLPLALSALLISIGFIVYRKRKDGLVAGALILLMGAAFILSGGQFLDYTRYGLFARVGWNPFYTISVFDRRDLVFLLGLIPGVFLAAQATQKNLKLWAICGAWVAVGILNSYDRAVYFFAVMVATLLSQSFSDRGKALKSSLWFSAGLLLGFLGLLLFYGPQEMRALFSSAKLLLSHTGFGFGLEYPSFLNSLSFSPGNWLFLAAPLVVASLLFVSNLRDPLEVLVLSCAVFCFLSALGRADIWHLQYSVPLLVLASGYYLWKFSERKRQLFYGISSAAFALVFFFAVKNLFLIAEFNQDISLAKNRIQQYVRFPDEYFLKDDQKQALTHLKEVFKDERCFFTFTNEQAWAYLLRKPSCTRYHAIILAFTRTSQLEVIRDLEKTKPAKILYESNAFPFIFRAIDNFPNHKRLPLIDEYLKKHYTLDTKAHRATIYRRRDSG